MKQFSNVFFILLFITSCGVCDFSGSQELGNNLVLFEGDRMEDRIIVRCTGRSKGCCKGGEFLIPSYTEHMSEGSYNEYVEDAESDGGWIIARTHRLKDKKQNYWIINKGFNLESVDCEVEDCNSLIRSFVTGPLDSLSFKNKIMELGIALDFE